ncbi:MAG TPA: hypothetical protein VG819_09660 [Rhizomicrobium sp.]|nr:hypothetical protein [Rhizomicrobium sp.]
MTKTRLPVEIAFLIVAKLVALTILYYAFFSASHRAPSGPRATESHLFHPNP